MSTLDAPPRPYATRGGVALAPSPERRLPAGPAAPVRPRHLRVVAPAERVRRRLTPAAGVLLTGLLFVTLFAIAIAHTLLVQGQIHLDALDTQLGAEQARYQVLRKEVAEAESPARVVAAAEAMGMVTPDDLVYLQPTAEAVAPLAADDTGSTPRATTSARQDEADAGDPGAGAAEVAAPRAGWSTMKPLLEAPAP